MFGEKQAKQEQCNFLEYRPKDVIDYIRKFLNKSYETEKDPICIYLHKETRGYLREFYLCPHQGNLTECKKVRTLDQKLKEYEESRRRAEANRSLGIMDAIDKMNTIYTIKDCEIMYSDSENYHVLESLRKKAGISGKICIGDAYTGGISLDHVINILEKRPKTKELEAYISVLKDIKSGNFDPSKYMTHHVSSGLVFVKFENKPIEHEPYRDDEGG
jgi:hypothetical protein